MKGGSFMTDNKTNDVLVEISDNVMHLTLNRPDSLNAFSPEMLDGLTASIKDANHDSQIRAIIIKGSGRAFSAGGDVKKMGVRDSVTTYYSLGKTNELIMAMHHSKKPIIAAVHGVAAGAGFNLAMAADIILAREDTKLILSFSKVGLMSDGGGSFFLTRVVGPYRAKELLLNAEPLSAQEAQALNIVNHVYEKDKFNEKVQAFANKMATGPATAYEFIKKTVNQSLHSNLEDILEAERITQATLVTTEEHEEGIQAFKEKRAPSFRTSN